VFRSRVREIGWEHEARETRLAGGIESGRRYGGVVRFRISRPYARPTGTERGTRRHDLPFLTLVSKARSTIDMGHIPQR
jgi:hypothetical protein